MASNKSAAPNSMTNLNTKKIVDILAKIPRIGAKMAYVLVAHFYAAPEDWLEFKNTMDVILKAGKCVCGNLVDTNQKYKKYGLCSFCLEERKKGIVIVPDIRVIYRIEDLNPGKFWYHVVRIKNDQVVVNDISDLVDNISHKQSTFGNKNIPIINGLGNDTLSNEAMNIIHDTLEDSFSYPETNYVNLPVGVPLGFLVQDIGDDTLSEILRQIKG